jgi:hypothetical protein
VRANWKLKLTALAKEARKKKITKNKKKKIICKKNLLNKW